MYIVYILQSLKDNKTYVGYTNNFERRFKQHNLGKSKSTKYRAPFKLLFKEEYENSNEAKKRELWWKSGVGRKKLKEFFEKSSDYKGTIIEESLRDKSVLSKIKILETKVEPITERHKTPWLSQWTLHTVEIPAKDSEKIAQEISRSFDPIHPHWYADYKNNTYHFIIFADKIFKIDQQNPTLYKKAKKYGISIGIPEYQVDFAPLSLR